MADDLCLLLSHLDHQKLEREARICRLLKHPNIGEWPAESEHFIEGREDRGWLCVCEVTSGHGTSPGILFA